MSRFKSIAEMDVIREQDRKLREKEYAEAQKVVATNDYVDGMFIVVARCVDGPDRGMFTMSQMIVDDGNGKPLKKPIRNLLIRGVDRDSLNRSFDKAIGKRYFK